MEKIRPDDCDKYFVWFQKLFCKGMKQKVIHTYLKIGMIEKKTY